MCDYLAVALNNNNFNAMKLIPYGSMHELIPYIVRRLVENSGLFGSAKKEIVLIKKEIRRRILNKE